MSITDRPTPADPETESASPSDDTTAESTALSDDDVFHILQTSRRREAIRYVLHSEDTVKMGALAEHVAAREHETTVAKLTSTQRQRVYIPLYQSHLPKLDKAGVIEYNKSRGIIRPGEHLETFRPYLEVATSDTPADDAQSLRTRLDGQIDTDETYYVATAAASVGLLLAAAFGLLPISGLTLGTIITTLFVLTTVACADDHRLILNQIAGRRRS
ncbi:hypothetical protein C483_05578 [Natrialba hulunbeirensis JCM 10989]|uniref:DUF7344 domain-containing protein n=1 Tax=Natrialba hulunbeirensis JCM 10989 TaxID=1227493 RepID=M0A4Z9_9EURY|nr:hypothetical protein [Natrialba hulunbeirensis]ELY93411.1 hypothetical protein C483_05578 [Natrialba hulunbeirensis JCM 10989]